MSCPEGPVQKTCKEIQEYYDEAISLVKQGGLEVVKALTKAKNVSKKTSETDLVTETDKGVEKLLVDGLRAKFPDHRFIGEEDTSDHDGVIAEYSNDPTWIIDPIDGTMNFVHSNHMVSISVALAINRRVVLGIILCPVIDKLYTAKRGHGAYLNGERIHTSGCDSVKNSLFINEVGSSGSEPQRTLDNVENFSRLVALTHGQRASGSACINLAMVASGQADAYQHVGIHCWDMAAGALLIREAGGCVVDPDGSEFCLMSKRILVAASEELVKEIVALELKATPMDKEFDSHCPI